MCCNCMRLQQYYFSRTQKELVVSNLPNWTLTSFFLFFLASDELIKL